ncbi:hypothetical protein CK203_111097 [Vitis vinifera]|uniref:Uncharacterized protein n=1 Tax=Vitis vinifera TaxID=29760 RepID=A0A438FGY4_VITVI|nr:hypothetical protein CK203_111097 [Vitis vinifera]
MKKWHDQLISNKEFQEGKEFYCMTQDSISFLGSSSQAAKASLAHECHFAAQEPHFAAAKRLRSSKALISQQKSHSAGYFAIAKAILAHVCHFAAQYIHFASCETHCELRPNFGNPKWREPEGQVFLSLSRKKSLRKEPVPDPVSEPSQPRAVPPPVKPVPPKPPARRYLTRPSPVPTPVPRRFLANSASGAISGAASKPQEPQPPLPSPKFHEIALEEVIRRPMLTQPPIEGNLDCRARHSTPSYALT